MTEEERLNNIAAYYAGAIQRLAHIYTSERAIRHSIQLYEQRMYHWYDLDNMAEVARCRGSITGLYALLNA